MPLLETDIHRRGVTVGAIHAMEPNDWDERGSEALYHLGKGKAGGVDTNQRRRRATGWHYRVIG